MNSANYDEIVNTYSVVGTNGGPSYYGTYDQCGNTYEWTEGNGPDIERNGRTLKTKSACGGRFIGRNYDLGLKADYMHYFPPEQKSLGCGLRICSQGYGNKQENGLLQKNPLANPLNYSTFVLVGDENNEPDYLKPIIKDGHLEHNQMLVGSVSYDYLIQKYPTTVEEYCEFLNAVAAKEDRYGLFAFAMKDGQRKTVELKQPSIFELINRGLEFKPIKGCGNKPIGHVNWYNAARFVNWLCNGKPFGKQDSSSTENGAYNVNGLTSQNVINVQRNKINPNTGLPPTYWLPSEDEWHKAAYYKGGSKDAGYWTFATQSDISPQKTNSDIFGNGTSYCPIPYHEHKLEDLKDLNGITTKIEFIDFAKNKVTLSFENGVLISYSKEP
jgi:formylglycine-generating enzyme required for sulfatase activity